MTGCLNRPAACSVNKCRRTQRSPTQRKSSVHIPCWRSRSHRLPKPPLNTTAWPRKKKTRARAVKGSGFGKEVVAHPNRTPKQKGQVKAQTRMDEISFPGNDVIYRSLGVSPAGNAN